MFQKQLLNFLLLLALSTLGAQENSTYTPIKEVVDIAYLPPGKMVNDSLQRLNLLLPEDVNNPPLLLWIGGGAWSFVDRHMEMDLCRKFAARGIAVASVGHRLSKGDFSEKRNLSGVQHPEHIKDIAAAFKWLVENARKYGYDYDHIFVGGFSSGAYLAALLGMDKRSLKAYGLEPEAIRGLLPISGAFDIVAYYNIFYNHEDSAIRAMAKTHVMDVFGEESNFIAASPITYISDLNLPLLLVSDNALYNYTRLFEDKLNELHYPEFQVYHERALDHAALWRELSTAEKSISREHMLRFIEAYKQ